MSTILSVQITVNETKISPARVVEEMVKGFVTLREHYFGLGEPDLSLQIETLTVSKPKRARHSRQAEKSDLPDYPAISLAAAQDSQARNDSLQCEECGWDAPDIQGLADHIQENH